MKGCEHLFTPLRHQFAMCDQAPGSPLKLRVWSSGESRSIFRVKGFIGLCYNHGLFISNNRSSRLLFSGFRRSIFAVAIFLVAAGHSLSQTPAQPSPTPAATPTPVATPTPLPTLTGKDALKNPTAEVIAETSIFVYGFGGGRIVLNQIRKTALERGKIKVRNAEGQMDQANYQKWTTRGDTLAKEKIRFDQEFSSARYSLIYTDEKTHLIFNDQVFAPREDTARAFLNQIFFGLDTLLRYKENESRLSLFGKEKVGGVEFHVVDVIDKQDRKTRFFISAKTFRVMMLEYEDEGIKYRRKYYDYNNAQGTLVPYRSVLFADDKVIEETDIGTVTFGQKIDESQFAVSQP